MGIVGWAQSPDPEPCANVADILAGLGIGQGDSSYRPRRYLRFCRSSV
jgi:hypothetical protein